MTSVELPDASTARNRALWLFLLLGFAVTIVAWQSFLHASAIEAKVFSMFGRRLLELISKVDQLMPMLETLCIDEAISTSELINEKSQIKKTVRAVTATTRALSLGLLKRINALPVSERKPTAPSTPPSPGDGSAGFRGHVQFHVGLLLENAHDTEKVFRARVATWSQHPMQALARFFER